MLPKTVSAARRAFVFVVTLVFIVSIFVNIPAISVSFDCMLVVFVLIRAARSVISSV
jgi:hypothetical protein